MTDQLVTPDERTGWRKVASGPSRGININSRVLIALLDAADERDLLLMGYNGLLRKTQSEERIRKYTSRDHVALLDPIRGEPEIAEMQKRIENDEEIENPLAEAVGALITRLRRERDVTLDAERRLQRLLDQVTRVQPLTVPDWDTGDPWSVYDAEEIQQALRDQGTTQPVPIIVEDDRDPECVQRWPGCENGTYNPACCRWPKSCSC